MMIHLYLTGFDGTGAFFNPYRPKFSDGAEASGLMSPRMRGLCLAVARSSDPRFNAHLLGEVAADPGSVLVASVARDQDLDQSAAGVIPAVSARLETSGVPGDFLTRNISFLTFRQVGFVIGALVQFYQRHYGRTHTSIIEHLLAQGRGVTDADRIKDALDTPWGSLAVSRRDELADTWNSHLRLPRRDFTNRFAGLPLRKLMYDAADQFDEVSMAVGINFGVPLAKNIGRMYTYGQARTQMFDDTFDASIDGNWDNPPENGSAMQWVTGGYIESATASFTACQIRRNAETFRNDQYCVATCQTQAATKYLAAMARIQPTTGVQDSYQFACWDAGSTNNHLRLVDGGSVTTLAQDNSPADPLAAGETISIECEASTIRGGYNRGAGDGQWGTDQTESTHQNGRPGVVTVTDTITDTQITEVSGGNIGPILGSVGQVTENDSAQAITVSTGYTVAQVQENDSVLPIDAVGVVQLGQVNETDSALTLAAAIKTPGVGLVTETNAALPLGKQKLKVVGQVTENDSVTVITRPKLGVIKLATENDSAFGLGKTKQKAIGQVQELDTALIVVPNLAFGLILQVQELDSVLPLGRLKEMVAEFASINESALGVNPVRSRVIAQVQELDSADVVTPFVPGTALGIVQELDSILGLGKSKAKALAQVLEQSSALSVTRVKSLTIAQAQELDSVLPITLNAGVLIGQVTELDSTFALQLARTLGVGQVTEDDSVFGLGSAKSVGILQVQELDTALALSAATKKALGIVTEFDTAIPVTIFKIRRRNFPLGRHPPVFIGIRRRR